MTEALAGPAPGRRRLTAGLVVLAWCAAVAVAATVAWVVVDRAGISLLGGSGPGLTGGVPAGATSTASSTASVTAGHSASLSSSGNRVTATCTTAGVISLGGAIPANGWQVEVKDRTPRLKVEFHSGPRTVEIEGVCRAGVPVLTLGHGGSSPTGSAPSPSTSDDHGGNRPGGGGSSGSGGGGDGGGSHGGSGGSGDSGGSGKSGSGG